MEDVGALQLEQELRIGHRSGQPRDQVPTLPFQKGVAGVEVEVSGPLVHRESHEIVLMQPQDVLVSEVEILHPIAPAPIRDRHPLRRGPVHRVPGRRRFEEVHRDPAERRQRDLRSGENPSPGSVHRHRLRELVEGLPARPDQHAALAGPEVQVGRVQTLRRPLRIAVVRGREGIEPVHVLMAVQIFRKPGAQHRRDRVLLRVAVGQRDDFVEVRVPVVGGRPVSIFDPDAAGQRIQQGRNGGLGGLLRRRWRGFLRQKESDEPGQHGPLFRNSKAEP